MIDTDKRCGSCRFWGSDEERAWYMDRGIGVGVLRCHLIEDDDSEPAPRPGMPDVRAIASLNSGSRSSLKTSAEFGCVLWEGK